MWECALLRPMQWAYPLSSATETCRGMASAMSKDAPSGASLLPQAVFGAPVALERDGADPLAKTCQEFVQKSEVMTSDLQALTALRPPKLLADSLPQPDILNLR
jgi:hypothetical protein